MLMNVVRNSNSIGFPRAFSYSVDDWFNDVFKGKELESSFVPSVDIREDKNGYTLSFDVPGVSKDELNIETDGNVLRLSGERKVETSGEKDAVFFTERTLGKFSRSFELPQEVEWEKIEATHRDGVLTISVPKAEKAKPRKINIKAIGSGE